eukprot:TRINITY_DN6606_c0_g1_i5.p3 TRINITY_DN6606_c0_g1~~TRINITY_DN6606_c0_g1_i5.p3  ORF type:complete len:161 (-),score=44.23 TRINITY_DN6606_c0_g1_i5:339-821(-)
MPFLRGFGIEKVVFLRFFLSFLGFFFFFFFFFVFFIVKTVAMLRFLTRGREILARSSAFAPRVPAATRSFSADAEDAVQVLPSARLAVSASLARDMKQRLDATHTARAFPPVVTGAIPRERLPGKALKDACVAEGIAVTVAEAREGGARADLFFPREPFD